MCYSKCAICGKYFNVSVSELSFQLFTYKQILCKNCELIHLEEKLIEKISYTESIEISPNTKKIKNLLNINRDDRF